MSTWKLGGCNKCGGSLFIDRDKDGWYEECLNCGYQRQLTTVVRERKPEKESWKFTSRSLD